MTAVLLSVVLPVEISEYIIKLSIHVFENGEGLKRAVDEWCEDKREAFKKYGDIKYWDTSKITDMSGLFFEKDKFNEDISRWDVSKVENMEAMFYEASSFNQLLNKWNVSNVKDMSFMFYRASSFNQPLNKWNVSNVTNMDQMFDRSGMRLSPPWYKK